MSHRLCLNMIVKDEAAIIERCCEALAPFIDCYVICDTGSTDDTVARIERVFARHGVPGEIVRTTFVNFEQARNEALDAARASAQAFDYILLCDADMELTETAPAWRTQLGGPAYRIVQRTPDGLEYPNMRLVRRDLAARYVGVTHEYLDVGEAAHETLAGLLYLDHMAGSSRATKFERDVRLLEAGLEAEPNNTRYVFYLANTLFDMGRWEAALARYRQREALGGWREEVFYARYRSGLCLAQLGHEAAAYHQLLITHDDHPDRAEPLHELALLAQRAGRHRLAHDMAILATAIPRPPEGLFVQTSVYTWRLMDIRAVSLYWLGRPADALELNEAVLALAPPDQHARILENIAFCRRAMEG